MNITLPLTKALISLSLSLGTMGCSNQWRESNPGVTDDEVFRVYDEVFSMVNSNSNNGGFDTDLALDLRQDPISTVYFAESGAAMGPVASVMSFNDMSFLGSSFQGSNIFNLGLSYVSVVFVDAVSSTNQRYFQLLIKMDGSSFQGPLYFAATSGPGSYDFSSDQFEVLMPLRDGTDLILRSFDLSPTFKDELAGTIQLKAYLVRNGQEFRIGQFSTLTGFGGF